MKNFSVVLIALLTACIAYAQDAGQSPFVGTWQLNAAKSKFNPGPVPKSQTVTIGDDGKVTVEGVRSDGTSENWSYTYMKDQEVPITGMPNSSVLEKRNGNTIEHTWKFNGGNYTGKAVLAKSGKRMTYTFDGTNPEGKHEHNVQVYDKQ